MVQNNDDTSITRGIVSGRLTHSETQANFCDLHPALSPHQASIDASRCYFCHDAPCVTACPTSIDIPLFIRQISGGNAIGAAETILEQNIMGAMCARVCPTEQLCEEACVRTEAEEKPVIIGQLQRYATDALFDDGRQLFTRGEDTGHKVAVVGAGPAGLACAHRLARYGHSVTIFEARAKAGGLNEYGIAAYKALDDIAQREADYILAIGGIELRYGVKLGTDFSLDSLLGDYAHIFVGIGLGGVNALNIVGEDNNGVVDAVSYIETLRQTDDLSSMAVGSNVVVIGGGMTAIDVAVQSKKLGADTVTLVYRRGKDAMGASLFEQELAQTNGVNIILNAQPSEIKAEGDNVSAIVFERTLIDDAGKCQGTGDIFTLPADMVFKAIGQKLDSELDLNDINMKWGRIDVGETRQTSNPRIWAGGDCILEGENLTVSAVEDGKVAAEAIHTSLTTATLTTDGEQG